MTREQAVKFLLEQPAKFGAMIGFDKLTDLHNKWIIEMVRGDGDKTPQAALKGDWKAWELQSAEDNNSHNSHL